MPYSRKSRKLPIFFKIAKVRQLSRLFEKTSKSIFETIVKTLCSIAGYKFSEVKCTHLCAYFLDRRFRHASNDSIKVNIVCLRYLNFDFLLDQVYKVLESSHEKEVINTEFENDFDKIDHDPFLFKLYQFGVRRELLKVAKSWF